jgi:hypothetical protein
MMNEDLQKDKLPLSTTDDERRKETLNLITESKEFLMDIMSKDKDDPSRKAFMKMLEDKYLTSIND